MGPLSVPSVQWVARFIGPLRVPHPTRSGASLEQMALRDHAWGRFRSVRIQPFSFLSLPLFFFLSSLWKRALRRKEPVRWKSTVTHPTARLYGRTYASSFWSHTTVWHRKRHSGNWFTLLCARITSPKLYTSYLYLSHICLFKVTHIRKSYVYRYLRYFWDLRRHSCVSTCQYSLHIWNVSANFSGSPTSNFMKSHSAVVDLLRVGIRTCDTQP